MRLRQLLNFLSRHPSLFLNIGIIAYILIFSGLSFWKYDNFLYNALDLGIYAQVFESFRTGNYWYSSIQQSSYLGDHFEPFILILLPFYLLVPHPKTLLVLQTIFLALPAVPLFFITKEIFKNRQSSVTLWALGVSFFYLFSPLVHNINLFEFHLLPFSLIFIFTASYFYIKKNQRSEIRDYGFFIIFCFLALFTREDIPLIVSMFGILALLEKRQWYWVIYPIILGAWWFILSMGIISSFNIGGGYKFLAYYDWAFDSNPLQLIAHIFGKIGNWEMVFGFLFAFLFLPLLKPRFLILALPVFLQFTLLSAGATGVVWQIHYASFFLPALFLSGIFGIKKIFIDKDFNAQRFERFRAFKFFAPMLKDRQLIRFIFILSVVGVIVVFGPLSVMMPFLNKTNDAVKIFNKGEREAQKKILISIPANASVLASSDYLPVKSINQSASALFYFYNGTKQYSDAPYIPAKETRYVLINSEDLLGFYLTYGSQDGTKRIREFIKEKNLAPSDYIDKFVLFSPSGNQSNENETDNILFKTHDSLPKADNLRLNDKAISQTKSIELIAFTNPEIFEKNIASFSLFWRRNAKDDSLYAMEIIVMDGKNKTVLKKIYPIAYGLYPPNDWEDGKIVGTHQSVLLPDNLGGNYNLFMRLVDASKGAVVLDSMRSVALSIPKKTIGEQINLGNIEVP